MSNLKLFCSYLRRQLKLILMLLLFVILFAVVFSLYNLPVESVAYASTLCLVVGFLLFAVGYAGMSAGTGCSSACARMWRKPSFPFRRP